jgi:hypothetical protein
VCVVVRENRGSVNFGHSEFTPILYRLIYAAFRRFFVIIGARPELFQNFKTYGVDRAHHRFGDCDVEHSISTNIRWSVKKRFDEGTVICAFRNLLGYDKDKDGNVVIVTEEAETVKEIFYKFLSGDSIRVIANALTEKVFRRPKVRQNGAFRR